jgi:hypothetical protein
MEMMNEMQEMSPVPFTQAESPPKDGATSKHSPTVQSPDISEQLAVARAQLVDSSPTYTSATPVQPSLERKPNRYVLPTGIDGEYLQGVDLQSTQLGLLNFLIPGHENSVTRYETVGNGMWYGYDNTSQKPKVLIEQCGVGASRRAFRYTMRSPDQNLDGASWVMIGSSEADHVGGGAYLPSQFIQWIVGRTT